MDGFPEHHLSEIMHSEIWNIICIQTSCEEGRAVRDHKGSTFPPSFWGAALVRNKPGDGPGITLGTAWAPITKDSPAPPYSALADILEIWEIWEILLPTECIHWEEERVQRVCVWTYTRSGEGKWHFLMEDTNKCHAKSVKWRKGILHPNGDHGGWAMGKNNQQAGWQIMLEGGKWGMCLPRRQYDGEGKFRNW